MFVRVGVLGCAMGSCSGCIIDQRADIGRLNSVSSGEDPGLGDVELVVSVSIARLIRCRSRYVISYRDTRKFKHSLVGYREAIGNGVTDIRCEWPRLGHCYRAFHTVIICVITVGVGRAGIDPCCGGGILVLAFCPRSGNDAFI